MNAQAVQSCDRRGIRQSPPLNRTGTHLRRDPCPDVRAAARRRSRGRRTRRFPSAPLAAVRSISRAGSPARTGCPARRRTRRRRSPTRTTNSRPATAARVTRGAPMRALKLFARTVLSLAMSAVFVWLSLRDTDLRAVGRAMASADAARIAAYVVLLLVIHLVRTVRWGLLLRPLGEVPFKRLNSASAVGWMLLMLLPLRLGEFARPLLIARPPAGGGQPLRRSGALASIVVERIVDGIAIGLLGIFALRMLGRSASGRYVEFAKSASVLVALGFLALCAALVLAVFFRDRAVALADRLVRPFSPRLAGRATGMLDAFIGAVHLGSGWRLISFFALTALYWTLTATGLGIVAPAFGFTALTPLMLAVILTIQVVGVMVPAGPGMVGTMQFFTQAGLSLFAADGLSARGAGLAHTGSLLPFGAECTPGLIFLVAGHVSLKGPFGATVAEGEATAPATS